jgi:hypothetical protein
VSLASCTPPCSSGKVSTNPGQFRGLLLSGVHGGRPIHRCPAPRGEGQSMPPEDRLHVSSRAPKARNSLSGLQSWLFLAVADAPGCSATCRGARARTRRFGANARRRRSSSRSTSPTCACNRASTTFSPTSTTRSCWSRTRRPRSTADTAVRHGRGSTTLRPTASTPYRTRHGFR